jgi:hypothetical protein
VAPVSPQLPATTGNSAPHATLVPDEHILGRYGSHLQPSQIGRQIAELLVEPRYTSGVAYGFRANVDIMRLDL